MSKTKYFVKVQGQATTLAEKIVKRHGGRREETISKDDQMILVPRCAGSVCYRPFQSIWYSRLCSWCPDAALRAFTRSWFDSGKFPFRSMKDNVWLAIMWIEIDQENTVGISPYSSWLLAWTSSEIHRRSISYLSWCVDFTQLLCLNEWNDRCVLIFLLNG